MQCIVHLHLAISKWLRYKYIHQVKVNKGSFGAVTHIIYVTHLCLLLLSRQAPPTMPTMSSTPRAPATTPPRNRPTPVALLESLLKVLGLIFSASTAGRVRDIAQKNYCMYVEVAIAVMWKCAITVSVFSVVFTDNSWHLYNICRFKVVESLKQCFIYHMHTNFWDT